MSAAWQFVDAPTTASLTTTFVLDGSPILRVYHDYEGGWQFHGSPDQPATPDVCKLVSLKSMIDRDSALTELYDLPHGWSAIRANPESSWTRAKNHPFPAYEKDGYYLEDAVWISQYLDDVHPPAEEIRNNLPGGAYVKLLFRFAHEDAERQHNETERMWVQITHRDDSGYYVGTLENDPLHQDSLQAGDTVHFHPWHVMERLEDDA
jgi:hypothetical protein